MNNRIHVSGIVDGTSVDGPGLRTSIYISGCRHRCPGCHNPQTWDFEAGEDMSLQDILKRIDDNGNNVTLSGGDPIYSAETILPLAKEIKTRNLNLWCYTGFTFEQIMDLGGAPRKLLDYIDVLVDGPYIESLRDTSLNFRGSSNQRLIDIPATLASGSVKLYKSLF